ncbi:hypothetical protein RZS08_17855, partial [Arthrospira platensis SPKY1]|nr:hypothetical protein [Arthrospira platensis SPKY1]
MNTLHALTYLLVGFLLHGSVAPATAMAARPEHLLQDESIAYESRMPMQAGEKLFIKNLKGSIRVVGQSDGPWAHIKVLEERSFSLLDRGSSSTEVKVWRRNNEIHIETSGNLNKSGAKGEPTYHVELTLPNHVELYVDNRLG